MASSDVVRAADALVTAINGASWGVTVVAVRKSAVSYDLQDLDTLRVTLVPQLRRFGLIGRGPSWENHFTISIAIQKRHGGDEGEIENSATDPIDGLAEDIMHWLTTTKISVATSPAFRATPVEIINEFVALDEHFWEHRVFTTVINCVYRVGPIG